MNHFLTEHWIELVGTIFAFFYLILSIRENIWMWPVGFLSSAFYLIVFFRSRLYADMALQGYYLIVSVYGWFHWLGNAMTSVKSETELKTTSVKVSQYWIFAASIFVILGLIYVVLKVVPRWLNLPPSDLPLGDAFTTAASLVATWMLARKLLENWLLWVVIDAMSMVMYIYKGLYITSALFLVYTLMAVVGYVKWKKAMRNDFCQ
ncbi:nicotinamide riboside transporter PnuC [Geofilum sp. OHC36d9]|uniref:nicotinamide riboside transporter PnuC n=1 Tax=Geofilum sp. OHC36d9 TaxID=3458413 RepID=UPI004034D41D